VKAELGAGANNAKEKSETHKARVKAELGAGANNAKEKLYS